CRLWSVTSAGDGGSLLAAMERYGMPPTALFRSSSEPRHGRFRFQETSSAMLGFSTCLPSTVALPTREGAKEIQRQTCCDLSCFGICRKQCCKASHWPKSIP